MLGIFANCNEMQKLEIIITNSETHHDILMFNSKVFRREISLKILAHVSQKYTKCKAFVLKFLAHYSQELIQTKKRYFARE